MRQTRRLLRAGAILLALGLLTACGESKKPAASADTVPELVGERLDDAEAELDDLGILWVTDDFLHPVEDASKWEVCATEPKAGKRVPIFVGLTVARIGRCKGRRE